MAILVSVALLLPLQVEDVYIVPGEEWKELELWALGLMTAAAYVHVTTIESHCWYNRWPWRGGGGKEWYIYRSRRGWGWPTAQQMGMAWGSVRGEGWGLFRGFIDIPAGSRLSLSALVRLEGTRRFFCEAVQRMALPPEPSSVCAFTDIGGFYFSWLEEFFGFCCGGGLEAFPVRPYVVRLLLRECYVSPYRGAVEVGFEFCMLMEWCEVGVAWRYFWFHGSRVDEPDFGGIFFWLAVWL